ncbi:hypothetical protein AAGF08_06790 [Algoriphagus sp. SE2]|uniref:hypothetical protein n=1 Tax=Algoriphagus sp. SE2 TaxID=3141536 RepID=UPI0031CD570F
MKFNFFPVLICLILLGSCSDDDSEPAKSDAELIGSGVAWKLSSATANDISIISLVDECILDNLITFNYDDKTGLVDIGASKCSDSEPQTESFVWDYNEASKALTVDKTILDVPGAEGNLLLESVTSNELVVSQNVSFSGFTQKVIVTLVH